MVCTHEKKEIKVYKFEFTFDECEELRRIIDEKLEEIDNADDDYKYYNCPFLSILSEELWKINTSENE